MLTHEHKKSSGQNKFTYLYISYCNQRLFVGIDITNLFIHILRIFTLTSNYFKINKILKLSGKMRLYAKFQLHFVTVLLKMIRVNRNDTC